jgi:glycogen(starch) synthase
MRILFLSQSYPPRVGGVETAVYMLARELAGLGHQVKVVTNRYPRRLPAWEVHDGTQVERLQFLMPRMDFLRNRRLDLWAASLFYFPATSLRLKRLVRAFRPDVVNVHFPDVMNPFVLRLRQNTRFRLVVSFHGDDVLRFAATGRAPGGRSERAVREVLRAADAVTACSPQLLKAAARLEPDIVSRSRAISNGIDPTRFTDRTPHRHPRPYLLALGRFAPVKGFDMLIDSFSRLDPGHGPIDLILAGEGEDRPALDAQVQRLGLGKRLYFYGKASPAEVVRLLNGCRLVVVPSRAESFGIVPLEALAAAKPVLATRVGGMGEWLAQLRSSAGAVLGQRAITLVEPAVEALAGGLRSCLEVNGVDAGLEALSAAVLREYSWARIARRYEEVLAGESRAPDRVHEARPWKTQTTS